MAGATRRPAASPDFERVLTELADAQWRRDLTVEEIGSPQRIAPWSVAISGDLGEDRNELGGGRLIVLHDPAGNESWMGTFRCVAYARAEVDIDMVADPLLPEVGWTWLTEALDSHGATFRSPAGTVTAVYSKSFGQMADHSDRAEVEVRASWTPLLGPDHPLTPHLEAWQELLCRVAGVPPLPDGVVELHSHRRGR